MYATELSCSQVDIIMVQCVILMIQNPLASGWSAGGEAGYPYELRLKMPTPTQRSEWWVPRSLLCNRCLHLKT